MEQFFAERRFAPHITMEVASGLMGLIEVIDTPVMRMWNLVCLQSKLLRPAADAFRRFILEHGEAHLLAGDTPLISRFFAHSPRRRAD
jgi:hypothetical protein